jgi:hypothetical protein
MDKEKFEGVTLQFSAIFARLNALKQSLPEESLKKYVQYMEKKKETLKEKYDVNEEQLDEWFQ